ncbi:MAG: hypothetical protein NT087_00445 [Deltaproteobacteria bacterium]|nr:hypothetical protein [Deltaproteobacteria bacterium]
MPLSYNVGAAYRNARFHPIVFAHFLKIKKAPASSTEAFAETILTVWLFLCLAAAPTTRGFLLFFDHAVAAAAIGAFFGLAPALFGCPTFFTFEYCHSATSGILLNGYVVQDEMFVLPDASREAFPLGIAATPHFCA